MLINARTSTVAVEDDGRRKEKEEGKEDSLGLKLQQPGGRAGKDYNIREGMSTKC